MLRMVCQCTRYSRVPLWKLVQGTELFTDADIVNDIAFKPCDNPTAGADAGEGCITLFSLILVANYFEIKLQLL
jgi:hypothetical protein